MAMPGTETIRFRRPTAGPNAVAAQEPSDKFGGKFAPDVQKWRRRHMGLLQDLVGRQQNGPFMPSFSLAVRLLLLVRTAAAMYSNIQDCDEVFNFFEPLHYLSQNSGFQTWELSPEFAVRSWTYILLHWPLAWGIPTALGLGKRSAFFCLRISLGVICSLAEAKFYRAVADHLNERVARYMLVGMMASAGMWNAGTAFLPSSFTLYTTMIASAYAMRPASNDARGAHYASRATFFFALGAIVGWPFSLLLAVPFVFEQLLLRGGDNVAPTALGKMRVERLVRLIKAGAMAALVAVPVFLIDSWAYGRPTFPTLNIVRYNLFSHGGPDLYGTEPASFYFLNLALNFNLLLPLALLSLPALAITYAYDFRRLGTTQRKPTADESSPYTLVALRLAPFYLWLAVMSAQPHKEERFMFPAYGALCLCAAVTVFLARGWVETAYVKITSSSYSAGQTRLFSNLALVATVIPMLLSISRVYALAHYYHSPLSVIHHFQMREIPNLLAAAGYKPRPPPKGYLESRAPGSKASSQQEPEWDYSPLATFEPKLRVCWGKEWYRYPSSWLVPPHVEVGWVRSEFDGAMPLNWVASGPAGGRSRWPRDETREVRPGRFNDMNKPSEEDAYVDPSTCTYMIDSSLPSQNPTALEPSYISSPDWEKIYCLPFLDAAASQWWARAIYLPGTWADKGRVWGDYCLMKRKGGREA